MQSKGAFEMRQKLKKQQGFTIIETMIVLAIAGLIMLIVFLAVPALQRSTRNTQRKNDAGNILTAIGNYVSNNNGQVPYDQTQLDTAINGIHLGYYTKGSVTFDGTVGSSSTPPTAASTKPTMCGATRGGVAGQGTVGLTGSCSLTSTTVLSTENVIFLPGYTCSGNTPTTSAATGRSYAIVYAIEIAANVSQMQCLGA